MSSAGYQVAAWSDFFVAAAGAAAALSGLLFVAVTREQLAQHVSRLAQLLELPVPDLAELREHALSARMEARLGPMDDLK